MADLEEFQENKQDAPMVNKEEMRSLSPEERIRRLKRLEEDRKREIRQAEDLIKESEREISDKEEVTRKIPMPQLRSIDASTLFSREEKALFQSHHQTQFKEDKADTTPGKVKARSETLEESLEAAPKSKEAEMGVRYGKMLEEALKGNAAYKMLSEVANQNEKGYLSSTQQESTELYKREDSQHTMQDGHDHNRDMQGLQYDAIARASDLEQKMGYAKRQFASGAGSQPKYKL